MDWFLFFIAMMTWNTILADNCNNMRPCALKTNEPLKHPEQLLSKNQLLEVTLKVKMQQVQIGGWLKLWRRTYNGKIGGPTLRVRPSDTVVVNLVNTLGPNVHGKPQHNTIRLANTTNLNFHGIHASPEANSPLVHVEPGELRRYTYKIGCKHPPGTYWYHPHVHGSTLFQTMSGMAGMIVVEDDIHNDDIPDYISAVSCPLHCEHEVQLLFQPTLLYSRNKGVISFSKLQKDITDDALSRSHDNVDNWLSDPESNVYYFTTNGQLQPRITIKIGEMRRFRMVNAGGIHALEIDVPRSDKGRRCEVYEIAKDGVYLDKPRKPKSGQTLLLPGGRVDWLIRCDFADTYQISSNPRSQNTLSMGKSGRIKVKLASLQVVKVPPKLRKSSVGYKEVVSSSGKSLHPTSLRDLRKLKEDEIKGRFVVEASSNNLLNREKYPHPSKIHVRHKMPLDGVQEWTLLNTDPVNAHTIHIPVNHFQIISYNRYKGPISTDLNHNVSLMIDQNGKPCFYQIYPKRRLIPKTLGIKKSAWRNKQYSSFTGSQFSKIGEWRDTILVPSLSNITIRFIPKHFTGLVFVQSHNLLNEDLGMLMVTEVVPDEKSMNDAYVEVNGALPGTCNPKDFYPKVLTPSVFIAPNTLRDFFEWLYKYKPAYMKQYGDQRYLSKLYGAYLQQEKAHFSGGNHLKAFFSWLYGKFPAYKEFYGDQTYLYHIYDYYITNNLSKQSVKKLVLG